MNTIEEAFDHDRALVFGIGGSGDIVGSIPTARLLEGHGLDVTLGGVTWEPVPADPRPGPRSFDEIVNLEELSGSVGLANKDTRTRAGLEFTETRVARFFSEEVVLIDATRGPAELTEDLDAAANQLNIDLIIGVDAGGDVLARGDEPGLRSPVIDGIGLAALDDVSTAAGLGVFGYGSDGELTIDELESAIARIAADDGLLGAWGLTNRVRNELRDLLQVVETEASRLPVEAAGGDIGPRTIRGGELTVSVQMPSMVTYYFDPETTASLSRPTRLVRGAETFSDAAEVLREEGYTTELDIEERRLAANAGYSPDDGEGGP